LLDEPKGIGRPRVPLTLDADARRLWAEVVTSLPDGLLTRADESALETFAREWATYREADSKIQKTGLLVQSPQGPVRNPLLAVRNQACRNMTIIGGNLGLSPVARARLAAPNTGDDDPMSLLLGMDGDDNGAWATAPKTKQ
jgi:P27 family predicted phage terminase small subunit